MIEFCSVVFFQFVFFLFRRMRVVVIAFKIKLSRVILQCIISYVCTSHILNELET
mgnify:CR=1 FL=1